MHQKIHTTVGCSVVVETETMHMSTNRSMPKVCMRKINPMFIISVGEVDGIKVKGSRQEFSLIPEILKKYRNIVGFIKLGR